MNFINKMEATTIEEHIQNLKNYLAYLNKTIPEDETKEGGNVLYDPDELERKTREASVSILAICE